MKKEAFLVCVALICYVFSNAQPIVLDDTEDFVEVASRVSFIEDKNASYTIEDVSQSSFDNNFKSSQQKVLHFGFTESIFWLKLTVNNPTSSDLRLEFAQAFLPDVKLFYKDGSDKWICYRSGYKINLNKKDIYSHFQVFPLKKKGITDYYIRIVPYMHAIPVRIWKAQSYEARSNKQKLLYGFYVGILFFAIAINIFLFFAFRRPYYLLYSILILLYIASSAAVMEGYIVYFFPNCDLMFWYKIIPVLDMPALLCYCMSFFELKKNSPKLYLISIFAIIYLILHLLFFLNFLPLMTALLVHQIYALGVFILAIVIGIAVGKKGNRLGYYFAISYFIWLILLSLEEIYIQYGKPSHLFDISYVSLAIFVEAFLLAYLLAKRFEWEKKEDQKIQLELQLNISQIQQKFYQEMLQSKLEIQEQTFRNISQEIHDNIGQVLTLAKLNLNTIPNNSHSEDTNNKLTNSKDLITKAIQDLRDLSKSLNTEFVSEAGLLKSIEYELELLKKAGNLQVVLVLEGEYYSHPQQKELILFRIFQEVLNNIMKHSQASEIKVVMNFQPNHFSLEIADNGDGFNVSEVEQNGEHGLGIKNMQNRSKIIGANFTINSQPGKGTTVRIDLPTHQP